MEFKLLALDLDGTLTNSKKEITPPYARNAHQGAAGKGSENHPGIRTADIRGGSSRQRARAGQVRGVYPRL